jgi:acyl-CoA thioester hydrolase
MHRHPPPTAASPDPRDLVGPFNHEVEVQVRFADTDAMRHVNNAKYLTYCEIARLRYWTDVTGEGFGHEVGAESLILAEARITYRAQALYGELVTVQTRATRIGRSSFTLEHRLIAGTAGQPNGTRRLVAVSDSVLVRFDYETAAPVPLSPEHIAALEGFEGRRLRD